MEITEVRIKLMTDPNDRLKAFCSITLDHSFVVRDLKIIQGGKGPFVAMPSRKLTDKCPKCGSKNNLRAAFCNDCGIRLRTERALKGQDGRAKLYADVAHPINSACRDLIQQKVLEAYDEEIVLAQQPGYICRYDDYGEDNFASSPEEDWDTAPNAPDDCSHPSADGPAETCRRLEPAAERTIPAPHRQPQGHRERNEAAATPRAAGGTDTDSFGEGIV